MFRSLVYDSLILRMTARWYAAVLERLPPGAHLLDVGIGTGGALLANADTVAKKDLTVTGVDIDADYIDRARRQLAASALSSRVTVHLRSVYDHTGEPCDAVYFSGSFMLLPDPVGALRHCAGLLRPGGRIYFTQTIQLRPSPVLERLKPALRRVTSIDFGHVTYEDDFRAQLDTAGLRLEEWAVLELHGSRAACLAVASPK
ncbi:bifunctional 2-polyprenyl-6-hydroxyphenol methylase/3-demethylubiquinol 3-O-methyltransferase UbiG [Thioalkalivibrio sp. ALJ24]|uniref:class I SAM-dependent methyltransferase n=1 Tax=Thioalkalivibrio sp. ALJ24 TaxID=545276 RepID=UPI00035CAAEC|nr:class I SAM-dependent methyltransferase [Thioalkalivibrio sp. ALJ24]